MKIILTSEFHRVADKLIEYHITNLNKSKVAFIQNALDFRLDQGEVVSWVEAGKQRYIDHGFDLQVVDLRLYNPENILPFLQSFDYLHIHGGDNKHLRDVCRDSGLFKHITTLLDNGLVYVGSSAGSIIAGPDITYGVVTSMNFQSNLTKEQLESIDLSGFKLHPFYLIPHAGKLDRLQMMTDRLHYCEEKKLSPYLTYNDNQAIIIEDNKFHFIQ